MAEPKSIAEAFLDGIDERMRRSYREAVDAEVVRVLQHWPEPREVLTKGPLFQVDAPPSIIDSPVPPDEPETGEAIWDLPVLKKPLRPGCRSAIGEGIPPLPYNFVSVHDMVPIERKPEARMSADVRVIGPLPYQDGVDVYFGSGTLSEDRHALTFGEAESLWRQLGNALKLSPEGKAVEHELVCIRPEPGNLLVAYVPDSEPLGRWFLDALARQAKNLIVTCFPGQRLDCLSNAEVDRLLRFYRDRRTR